MDNDAGPLRSDERRQRPGFRNIQFVQGKRYRAQGRREILPPPRAEIIHAHDLMTRFQQEIGGVTADKSGGTGDEDLDHG